MGEARQSRHYIGRRMMKIDLHVNPPVRQNAMTVFMP
jgi:uncharacterized protein YneF (UPF0154 family)